jgi:hypothetical protein
MTIEKRLSDLEKAVARSNPVDLPLPEATRRLYEKVFGSAEEINVEHFAAELARGECVKFLPEAEGLDIPARARALVDTIIADLEADPPDPLAVLMRHDAVIEVFLRAEEELALEHHRPAAAGCVATSLRGDGET